MAHRLNDFKCNDCNEVSEIFYDTEQPVVCPKCKSSNLTKMIGAPRIVTGVKSLYNQTPSGFKDVIKQTFATVPDHAKGKAPGSL